MLPISIQHRQTIYILNDNSYKTRDTIGVLFGGKGKNKINTNLGFCAKFVKVFSNV